MTKKNPTKAELRKRVLRAALRLYYDPKHLGAGRRCHCAECCVDRAVRAARRGGAL